MYATVHENRDFGVTKKYEHCRSNSSLKVPATKKGSFLDDEIKMSCSPGPASTSTLIQIKRTLRWTGARRKDYSQNMQIEKLT